MKKPNSYARESYDKLSEHETVKNLTSIKGINHCYNPECESDNISYDFHHDEVYCKDCGTVLRQANEDYEDTIKQGYDYTSLTDETLTQPYNNRIEYYQDLMKQSETEVLGTI